MAFLLGSFGWFFMWFLLFIKQMPVFALAEIKEIVPPQMRGRAGTADQAMEHGGMANPLTSGGPHTAGGTH
jgi:molybdopterin-containing oxidoreductase family membrane subunit